VEIYHPFRAALSSNPTRQDNPKSNGQFNRLLPNRSFASSSLFLPVLPPERRNLRKYLEEEQAKRGCHPLCRPFPGDFINPLSLPNPPTPHKERERKDKNWRPV